MKPMNILLKIYCMPVILKNLRSHHVLLVCFLLAFSSQSIANNLTWDLLARVGFDFTRPLGQTWLRKPLQRWQS